MTFSYKTFLTCLLLLLGSLSASAQQRMIRLHNADGTSTVASVGDINKMTFLSPGVDSRELTVVQTGGAQLKVNFINEPSIAFSEETLVVSSVGQDQPVTIEFDNLVEMTIGSATAIHDVDAGKSEIKCSLSANEAVFTGISKGNKVMVYSQDGKLESIRQPQAGEVRLNRGTLSVGIHIVRIGRTVFKIHLR